MLTLVLAITLIAATVSFSATAMLTAKQKAAQANTRTWRLAHTAPALKESSATQADIELAIAEFFVVKYCMQTVVSGHYQAARNLRKQGVPLEVAMMILFGKRA